MAFDLKEIVASRLGENYQLDERHLDRTLAAAQRVIGFDKVYARAEGSFLATPGPRRRSFAGKTARGRYSRKLRTIYNP